MKKTGCLIAVVAVVVILGFFLVGTYNGLVGSEQAVEAQWAQVQNVYQRRADLIPNLVASVKGAAGFEQQTLTQVVEARSRVGQISAQATNEILNDPQKFAQFQQAQDGLSSALSRLMVVVERYPTLQAVPAFRDLMVQLEGHGEPHRRRAARLQPGGPGLQHPRPPLPGRPLRRHDGLPAQAVLPGDHAGSRNGAEGGFRDSGAALSLRGL